MRIPARLPAPVRCWYRCATVAAAEEVQAMADVAYVLVLVGGFVLLATVLRGLEEL